MCACVHGVGGHAHAPARSTAGPSRPLNGSCCNLGADQALGDLPPSPFICARLRFEVSLLSVSFLGFPGSVIHRSGEIKGRVHLLVSTVAVWLQRVFTQSWNGDTPGSVVAVSESWLPSHNDVHSGFYCSFSTALYRRLYKELIHKCRHLVEGDAIEMNQPHPPLYIND